MTFTTQMALLQDAYRDKLALYNRHVAGAARIADYEANNTYQYVIARDEHHLQWLRDAVFDLDGQVPAETKDWPVPGEGRTARDLEREIASDDARLSREFHERWTAKLTDIRNARHRRMIEVLLGEVLEQRRFFEQAAEGRDDLLGRRMPGASTGDGVLSVRWME